MQPHNNAILEVHNNAILEVLIQIVGIVFNIFIFSQKSVEFGGHNTTWDFGGEL